MQFGSGAMAFCKITGYKRIKYKTTDPKKDVSLMIWFKSDYPQGILYKTMENVYLLLVVGFLSRLTIVFN